MPIFASSDNQHIQVMELNMWLTQTYPDKRPQALRIIYNNNDFFTFYNEFTSCFVVTAHTDVLTSSFHRFTSSSELNLPPSVTHPKNTSSCSGWLLFTEFIQSCWVFSNLQLISMF